MVPNAENALWQSSASQWWQMDLGASTVALLSIGYNGDTWIWEPALWHCSALGIWWYMDLGASTVVMLSIGHDDTWTWEQTMWQCSALGIVTRRPGSSRAHFSFISGHDCVLPHKIDPLYTRTCTGTEHFSRFFTFLPLPTKKKKVDRCCLKQIGS